MIIVDVLSENNKVKFVTWSYDQMFSCFAQLAVNALHFDLKVKKILIL